MPDQTVTVLAGDLVASTDLTTDDLDLALDALRAAATLIETWHATPVHFTRNRGDGWQICLPGTAPGIREALALRAGLRQQGKAYETRIAIATGPAALPENGDLNRASGPAFVGAGHLLDRLSDNALDHAGGGALSATLILAGQISQGWTPAQARAILPMLAPAPPIQSDVAARNGITRQAIQQALSGAAYPALAAALSRLEQP
ncbi:MarR family transcriptional regulator [Pseudooceanicola sediminis]|uniref:MarR family transcriptional regulator n=1 Tax=Pseudooceanicola sediminis TaxID=2211117 RepID=A0A399IZ22_9RHOB|nr:MarR family transcriptional regulator [Pseudooceanicola sediminis]KAA2316104.1 MarR family transcriptional regulator [Puniceibacterium sp. HSS470]RII38214.1 MarR family transcriptional regulator [Pseudooceanicola sediminis]|tara:strand:- start:22612 stop:23223 length:612 start_codon:yes stop_codon:yes gene_type:complete